MTGLLRPFGILKQKQTVFFVVVWTLLLITNISSFPKDDRRPNTSLLRSAGEDKNNKATSNPSEGSQPENNVKLCSNPSSNGFKIHGCDISKFLTTPIAPNKNTTPTIALNTAIFNLSSTNKSTPPSKVVNQPRTNPSISLSGKLTIFFFACTLIIGVFGNAFVCFTFGYKCRVRRTVTESLLLYLAIVDMISSFVNPLLYIYWIITGYRRWDFGYIACKILPPIGPISTTASAGIILLICIDRYRSIVTPFKTRLSIFQVNIITIVIIFVSIFSHLYYIIHLTVMPGATCLAPRVGDLDYSVPNVTVTLFFDLVYVLIFVPANIRIFRHLKASEDLRSDKTYWDNRRKATGKVMRVLFTVGLIFAVLVFPRDILHLIFTMSWMFPPGLPRSALFLNLNNWFKVLHVSNSCANIFIYSHMHEKFKREIKSCFTKCCRKWGTSETPNDATEKGTGFSIENTETSYRHKGNSEGSFRRKSSLLQKLLSKDRFSPRTRKKLSSRLNGNTQVPLSNGTRSPTTNTKKPHCNGEVGDEKGGFREQRSTTNDTNKSQDRELNFGELHDKTKSDESPGLRPRNIDENKSSTQAKGTLGNYKNLDLVKAIQFKQDDEKFGLEPYSKYQAERKMEFPKASHGLTHFSKSKLFGVTDIPHRERKLPSFSDYHNTSENDSLLPMNQESFKDDFVLMQSYDGLEIAKKLSRERKCGFQSKETNL